jgi:hypothetical protein
MLFVNRKIIVPQDSFFSALKNLFEAYMGGCKCVRNQKREEFDTFYLTIKNGLKPEDILFIKTALETSSIRFLIGDELLIEV